jgi:hypothetical protein
MAGRLNIMESEMVVDFLKNAPAKKNKDFDKIIEIPPHISFKNVQIAARPIFGDINALVFNRSGNYVIYM